MINLDGNYGEGGGALVRTALALSTFTSEPFSVNNIRAGRPEPGLKAQHLTAINALKELCHAETNNIQLGSTELTFRPGKLKSGKYEFDIGTAGSITLLLQALILPCLFAPGKITLVIKGGTCGKWQASVDYLQNILLPYLENFTQKIELKILKRGYYPKGGGEISLTITPKFKLSNYLSFSALLEELQAKTPKIKLEEQGTLQQIKGIVNVASDLQDSQVAERIQSAAINSLKSLQIPVNIQTTYANTLSVGGEVLLWAIFNHNETFHSLASSALISKKQTSEGIGQQACQNLKQEIASGAPVDYYLADQLILFMSLLPNSTIITSKVTNHTHTNIYVVEKFLPVGFKVEDVKITVKSRNTTSFTKNL